MNVSEAVVEGVSGAVGSVLALLATYPLKTIYTLQALSVQPQGGKDAAAVLSTLDIIRKYRLSGLYIGIEPNVIESAVSSGVYFYLYSKLRDIAVRSNQARLAAKQKAREGAAAAAATDQAEAAGSSKNVNIGVLASLLVAAIAGAGNQLITLPASVLATRMQAQQKLRMDTGNRHVPTSAPAVMSLVYRESGILGFWKGLLPSLVLVVNPAVQYMLYEQLLRLLRHWKQQAQAADAQAVTSGSTADDQQPETSGGEVQPASCAAASAKPPAKLSSAEIFVASALAKIGATVVTYPLIVVKSRLQAAGKGGSARDLQYATTFSAISHIWGGEGVGGFFKGLRAKILQTALNAALMLMLKEQIYTATRTLLSKGSVTAPKLALPSAKAAAAMVAK
mmetsp:Transcript_11272/g.24282  ORF Transcript_11272/g.24282 Transcript_11272/m.24282 type:complete len:394 (-) Transcript_11272:1167-2348(-)|eukprot:CAMPEP_0202915092 /NCGR_PEP_ID=MMETSP1392-20130828/64799_1 /ASSEMBLY_ACC=CAM_ASM_000868 /TAXON_ID=225041 /ORGANISM="Chlamydomonas chlamydogama, Strain SAG 11-48b" /LENGTH=393 /DNA_ID=CAMNT_0049606987 /DNA_START=219 /DNA_END=1400 /DNA_ORIENTATION=+